MIIRQCPNMPDLWTGMLGHCPFEIKKNAHLKQKKSKKKKEKRRKFWEIWLPHKEHVISSSDKCVVSVF